MCLSTPVPRGFETRFCIPKSSPRTAQKPAQRLGSLVSRVGVPQLIHAGHPSSPLLQCLQRAALLSLCLLPGLSTELTLHQPSRQASAELEPAAAKPLGAAAVQVLAWQRRSSTFLAASGLAAGVLGLPCTNQRK